MERGDDDAMHQHRHEGDGYRRIEVITGVARRRRWTAEEKAAMVAESLRPGINVSDLARRCGVNRGLLQTWRRMALQSPAIDAAGGGVFVPLRIEDASALSDPEVPGRRAGAAGTRSAEAGKLEIAWAGLRICFSGPIDAAALRLVLARIGRRP